MYFDTIFGIMCSLLRNSSAKVPCPNGGAHLFYDVSVDDDDDKDEATREDGEPTSQRKKAFQTDHDTVESDHRTGKDNPYKLGSSTGVGDSAGREVKITSFSSIFTSFVEGILDRFEYHQISSLFAQFGRIKNVFVQKQRKIIRRYRFRFVQFASLELASQVINLLNGFHLGDAFLFLATTRFPWYGYGLQRKQVLEGFKGDGDNEEEEEWCMLVFSKNDDEMIIGLDKVAQMFLVYLR